MTKQSKSFKKWADRIANEVTPWGEKEIIYFRKAIGGSGLKDKAERIKLRMKFNNKLTEIAHYDISGTQSEKGIKWLKNYSFKVNGGIRKNCLLGYRELEIIKNFKEFKFVNVIKASPNSYECYMPVYRVLANNGDYFEYYVNGGQVRVVN